MSYWNDEIVRLSETLLERAKKLQSNEDLYAAGLRESEVFGAVADILNYYREFYHNDDKYVLQILLERANKHRSEKVVKEVIRNAKRY